jgi:hypothetical protein
MPLLSVEFQSQLPLLEFMFWYSMHVLVGRQPKERSKCQCEYCATRILWQLHQTIYLWTLLIENRVEIYIVQVLLNFSNLWEHFSYFFHDAVLVDNSIPVLAWQCQLFRFSCVCFLSFVLLEVKWLIQSFLSACIPIIFFYKLSSSAIKHVLLKYLQFEQATAT